MPIFWGTAQEVYTNACTSATQTASCTQYIESPRWQIQKLLWWNNSCTTAATTTIPYLIAQGTTSTTIDNYVVYSIVEDNVTPTQYYELARKRIYICRERDEAKERRLAEELRQRMEAQKRWDLERKIAATRARDLLLSHLTKDQRKTFEENRWFVVKGGKTGLQYRIHTDRYAGNISVLQGDKVVASLCCHAEGVPLHDHHLSQKLALQYDEERFLRIANRTDRILAA